MGVTNADIKTELGELKKTLAPLPVTVATLAEKHEAVLTMLAEHHRTLYGNGKPGLVSDMTTVKSYGRASVAIVGLILTLLGIMQGLTGCQASGQLATAIDNSNTQLAAQATYNATTPAYSVTPYPTLTNEPTPTLTPCCGGEFVTVTPHPTTTPVFGIIEFSAKDIEWLSRLCVIEIRSFGGTKDSACLSVVSTVVTRVMNRDMSDGTIQGTLGWGCEPDTVACQFPAFIMVDNCGGVIPQACYLNYPEDTQHFNGVVVSFIYDGARGLCNGYEFYGDKGFDAPTCVIKGDDGSYLNFHH